MTIYTILDYLPIGLALAINFLLFAAVVSIGFAWGKFIHHRLRLEPDPALAVTVTATLSLLAFLLTITFSIAASFFEMRRNLLLDETNAISTTWLRAGFLDKPHSIISRDLLREYVDLRVEATRAGNIAQALSRSQVIQDQLWSQALAVGQNNPNAITVGLFINSLNEVIDLHAKRVTFGLYTRIPSVAWTALYLVAIFAMALLGYQAGLTEIRRFLATALLILAFSVVFFLIIDLDRPAQGMIRVNLQPLLDLQKFMHTNP